MEENLNWVALAGAAGKHLLEASAQLPETSAEGADAMTIGAIQTARDALGALWAVL